MIHRLPSFAIAALLSFTASASAQVARYPVSRPPGPPDPSRLMAQAIETLESHASVEARMKQVVQVFDQRLVGSGVYVQGPRGSNLMRFELRLQVASHPSSLTEVCDGHYLWTHRLKDGDSTLTRLDVQEVFHKQRAAVAEPAAFRPRLAMGGLRRLLDALAASYDFPSVEEGTIDGVRVWNLRGNWTEARLAALLADRGSAPGAGEGTDVSRLAPHVPDHVIVSLGTDDLFPYRIDYRRGEESLVRLTLFDVELDRPIDVHRFRYQPPDQEEVNVTDQYLRDIGLAP